MCGLSGIVASLEEVTPAELASARVLSEMMRMRLIYGAVALLSVAVGVLLGGGPATIFGSSGTAAKTSSAADIPQAVPDAPEPITAPPADSTISASTTAPITSPASTTTSNPTTTAGVATIASTAVTTSPTVITSTAVATNPTVATGSTEPAVLLERTDLTVAVANGIGTVGAAGRTATILAELGYSDPATRDTGPAQRSVVYFRVGLDAEAGRLATDVGLAQDSIAAIEGAPNLLGSDDDFDLLLVLGVDLAER